MSTHDARGASRPRTPSGRLGRGPRRPTTTPERLGSVMGHHFLVYRRTWRGSIISRFLSPLFFLLSMGLGLGALVDDSAGGVDGLPYLQFVVPGILAMQAMMTAFGESTYAGHGLHQVEPDVRRDARHAAAGRRGARRSPRRRRVPPLHRRGDLRRRRGAVRRVRLVVGGARRAGRRAHRPGLRRADLRPGRPARERQRLQHPVPVRRDAADAVLRHLLPDRPAAGVDAAARLGHPAVARRRAVPRRRHRHRARLARAGAPGGAAASTSASAGCSPARSFTRRLVS